MSSKSTNEPQYDLRVLEQKIRKGTIDPKEYEAYLKKLPDDAQRAEYIEVYEEPRPEELTPFVEEPTFT